MSNRPLLPTASGLMLHVTRRERFDSYCSRGSCRTNPVSREVVRTQLSALLRIVCFSVMSISMGGRAFLNLWAGPLAEFFLILQMVKHARKTLQILKLLKV